MTNPSRQVHTLICCLLLTQGATSKLWGYSAGGIRLLPRQQSLRRTADDCSSRRSGFSIRDKFDLDDQDIGEVDFCSAQRQASLSKPTNAVLTSSSSTMTNSHPTSTTRGGTASVLIQQRPLVFWESMVCGAISRSIAQTVMHPANTMKTILQSYRGVEGRPTISSLAQPSNFRTLTRGAGANFLLSVPHGAVNFAVLELVRYEMSRFVQKTPFWAKRAEAIGPGLDFMSSAVSTVCCSIVSTPQMMITDNIMAGNYPNLSSAVKGLWKSQGLAGFYTGWWPGLAGKIPSYALTWTLFQQLKAAHARILQRPPKDLENSVMGCLASATTVCIMIPMDTIKTRLVTQASMSNHNLVPYKGIVDCAVRVAREEGIRTLYRGLPPRLVSVVPMIGIQFGVYEFMKKVMLNRSSGEVMPHGKQERLPEDTYGRRQAFEEISMEVAADDEQPFPAPRFGNRNHGFRQTLILELKGKAERRKNNKNK